jgi:hypothetical protein
MLVQPTQPEIFASQPEPAARRLGDTVAHLQEETQQRARLAHQALNEFKTTRPRRGKGFIADSNRWTGCDASLKNLAAMKRSGEICGQN